MTAKSTLIAFLLLVFTSLSASAQTDSVKSKYKEDFNTFIQFLEETHPDPYTAFGGRVEFGRAVRDMRKNVETSANDVQFRNSLSRFLSQLEDGHTIIYTPTDNENSQSKQFFPIVFKVATDVIFVDYSSKEFSHLVGNKLLAVNDIELDLLLKKINTTTPAENRYGTMLNFRNQIANQQSASTFLENTSNVTLTLQDTKGNVRKIEVNYQSSPDWQKPVSKIKMSDDNKLLFGQILQENRNIGYFQWNAITSREVVESIPANNPQRQRILNYLLDLLHIEKLNDDNNAIGLIPALYPEFYSLLEEMKMNKSEYLIVDLRENSGGMTPLTLPLLYMLYGDKYLNYKSDAQYIQRISPLLLKKWGITVSDLLEKTDFRLGDYEFGNFFQSDSTKSVDEKRKDLSLITYRKRFGKEFTENLNGQPVYQPKVIVLCSPTTFSASFHFLYYLSEIGNATIIGVPPSQAGNAFMETTFFELPLTKIEGSISNSMQVFFPNDKEKGKVLVPDFAMTWKDYGKYNFDKNAELLYCLDLIKTGKL